MFKNVGDFFLCRPYVGIWEIVVGKLVIRTWVWDEHNLMKYVGV